MHPESTAVCANFLLIEPPALKSAMSTSEKLHVHDERQAGVYLNAAACLAGRAHAVASDDSAAITLQRNTMATLYLLALPLCDVHRPSHTAGLLTYKHD